MINNYNFEGELGNADLKKIPTYKLMRVAKLITILFEDGLAKSIDIAFYGKIKKELYRREWWKQQL